MVRVLPPELFCSAAHVVSASYGLFSDDGRQQHCAEPFHLGKNMQGCARVPLGSFPILFLQSWTPMKFPLHQYSSCCSKTQIIQQC